MIAECLILIASFQGLEVLPNPDQMYEVKVCISEEIPHALVDDIPYFVQFFDYENLDTAVRIAWCESRGKSNAYRSSADDSGLFQFIPRTWRWMVELFGIPEWDRWEIMRFGEPHYEPDKVYTTDFGFEQVKVQFSPYWNVKAASHLAEDTYKNVRGTDWNSSKWCWGDPVKWRKLWKAEEG